MNDRAFADTNVLLYVASADHRKAGIAERILDSGPFISVQVLNEVANVARRKMKLDWGETHQLLASIRELCPQVPLTVETHDLGLEIAESCGLSIYDSMIVAAALRANCTVLYSEDMQHAQLIKGTLRIQNPFAG